MFHACLVSFSATHTFCPPVLPPFLSLWAQAVRKCQVGPGYFRPNWEIDAAPETWQLDVPFIPPRALPPEPDMLTTH